MELPTAKEIELPLLLEIEKAGGAAHWRTLFQLVASHFSGLNGKDLEEGSRFRWASYYLSKNGDLIRKGGIWTITNNGRARLRLARLPTTKPTCKCGCGTIVPQSTMYVPGHDAIHRSKLIEKAGGVDSLQGLLRLADSYMAGDIGESELARGIRQLTMQFKVKNGRG